MAYYPSSNVCSPAKASDSEVETNSRLARWRVQWRIEDRGPCSNCHSDAFQIGLWNWRLFVEKSGCLNVRLCPEPLRAPNEPPPVAKFVLRFFNPGSGCRPYISPVHEKLLRTLDDFVWTIDSNLPERFTVEVEFLDLKIPASDVRNRVKELGAEATSIWPYEGMVQSLSSKNALRCLSRMLEEGIHSDITIKTSDGVLKAHKALLASSSPVFESMFLHDLKVKESSTIIIEDMSLETCLALLGYIYGSLKHENFWKHRLSLIGAANKYDITELKDCCEESLLEDINTSNVLERLQVARLYRLNKLKKGCLTYLFDFGKIYDVEDEMSNFFRNADRELLMELFQESVAVWKPF